MFGICSVREIQAGLRSQLEQGLQMLLAGPEVSSRLRLQLATRIDEVASRRRMHGSLRFRSAQELADRLVVRFPMSLRFFFSRVKTCCRALKLRTAGSYVWSFRNILAGGARVRIALVVFGP